MFDIGGPEFLVICVIALLVIGPERLPETMRRVGRVYRQVRELVNQYTGEAQRMFDEGMQEAREVTSTLNTALLEVQSSADTGSPPPPRLVQVAAPLLPATTAAAAGPWTLPAYYRDARPEAEPRGLGPLASPPALPTPPPVPDGDSWALAGDGFVDADWEGFDAVEVTRR